MIIRNCCLRLIKLSQEYGKRKIYTSHKLQYFYEPNRKGEWLPKYDIRKEDKYPEDPLDNLKARIVEIGKEFVLFKDEFAYKMRNDPILRLDDNEVDPIWEFNSNPDNLDQWILSMDSDYDIGHSSCTFEMSPEGHSVFSGFIDPQPVKGGKYKYAGYCNISTQRKRKSFYRRAYHVWSLYTHLVLRIRGDGRTYMINIHPHRIWDITRDDLYSFALYTRGGPYWQFVKIPFSKFLISSKGRVQDKQSSLQSDLQRIERLGITAADGILGPFKLEIDFIGVVRDRTSDEKFAYEMYKPPNPYYT